MKTKDEIIDMIRKGEFINFRESLVDLVFSFNEKRRGLEFILKKE